MCCPTARAEVLANFRERADTVEITMQRGAGTQPRWASTFRARQTPTPQMPQGARAVCDHRDPRPASRWQHRAFTPRWHQPAAWLSSARSARVETNAARSWDVSLYRRVVRRWSDWKRLQECRWCPADSQVEDRTHKRTW